MEFAHKILRLPQHLVGFSPSKEVWQQHVHIRRPLLHRWPRRRRFKWRHAFSFFFLLMLVSSSSITPALAVRGAAKAYKLAPARFFKLGGGVELSYKGRKVTGSTSWRTENGLVSDDGSGNSATTEISSVCPTDAEEDLLHTELPTSPSSSSSSGSSSSSSASSSSSPSTSSSSSSTPWENTDQTLELEKELRIFELYKFALAFYHVIMTLFNLYFITVLKNKPPFRTMYMPLLYTAELFYFLMGVSRVFGYLDSEGIYPNSPSFLRLDNICFFYGVVWYLGVYFPFCTCIITTALHLKIEYQTAYDSVHSPKSFFYNHKRLLKTNWLYPVLSLPFLALGCPSTAVLLHETKTKNWFLDMNDESLYPCTGGDYTLICNESYDVTSTDASLTVLFFALMVVSLLWASSARDAFNVRLALTVSGLAISSANLLCNIFIDTLLKGREDSIPMWQRLLPSASFGFCLFVSRLAFPFGTILHTLRVNKDTEAFKTGRNAFFPSLSSSSLTSTGSSAPSKIKVAAHDQSKNKTIGKDFDKESFTQRILHASELLSLLAERLNSPEVREFQGYLISEFCPENLIFLRISLALRSQEVLEVRRKYVSGELAERYFAKKAPDPLSVSPHLRAQVVETVEAEGGRPDFWAEVEAEVAGLLLSPYNRFAMTRKKRIEQGLGMSNGYNNIVSSTGSFLLSCCCGSRRVEVNVANS